jgi:hypothetical protein
MALMGRSGTVRQPQHDQLHAVGLAGTVALVMARRWTDWRVGVAYEPGLGPAPDHMRDDTMRWSSTLDRVLTSDTDSED